MKRIITFFSINSVRSGFERMVAVCVGLLAIATLLFLAKDRIYDELFISSSEIRVSITNMDGEVGFSKGDGFTVVGFVKLPTYINVIGINNGGKTAVINGGSYTINIENPKIFTRNFFSCNFENGGLLIGESETSKGRCVFKPPLHKEQALALLARECTVNFEISELEKEYSVEPENLDRWCDRWETPLPRVEVD